MYFIVLKSLFLMLIVYKQKIAPLVRDDLSKVIDIENTIN